MSGRSRRAALHQRSDSETNEIRTNPSLHSNNSSVSQKATDVSTWVPPPATATVSRNSTRSSSRTVSTNSSRRASGSINSLPPVPPLKIYKRESAFIVARDPSPTVARESLCPDTLVGGPGSSQNSTPPKAQTFPKSILKKPSQPALPPYTVEEYNQKSSSWVGSDSQSPTTASQSKMNSRTLRLVHSEDDSDAEGEESDVVGGLVSRQRSTSFSPRATPSPRLATGGESSAQSGRTFPIHSPPTRSPSDASLQRPGTAGSLFASAKQLPAWARYFYGKKGGRGSIIEPDISKDGNGRDGAMNPRVRRQQSDDSMLITEIIPPDAIYHGSRRWASSESIPGIDWIGSRTRAMDPEIATQWSTPHLDHPPPSRFENIDRQLILFCLGFILPVCWIIGAFLPLPPFYGHTKIRPNQTTPTYYVDVEAGSSPTIQKQRIHENAKWWRTVNRILSGLGLALISAIITMCAVAVTRGA